MPQGRPDAAKGKKKWFLNFGSIDIWGWILFSCEKLSCKLEHVEQHPGLYSLHMNPSCNVQKVLPDSGCIQRGLLYSTGNYIQCPVKEYKIVCVCV